MTEMKFISPGVAIIGIIRVAVRAHIQCQALCCDLIYVVWNLEWNVGIMKTYSWYEFGVERRHYSSVRLRRSRQVDELECVTLLKF